MISREHFNDATSQKRRDMAKRLKEKLWKSGKRAGTVRRRGRELPFTLHDFRRWVMEKVGMGMVRCHYCPRSIDVLSFEPDHYVPLELDGGIGLDNLVPACSDCNRLKGAMPPLDFIALMEFLDTNISTVGRADIKKRLRAGAMGVRNRHFPHVKKGDQQKQASPETTKEIDFF
jgi:5-methylcytosine-specific restriction endonuclease McrA